MRTWSFRRQFLLRSAADPLVALRRVIAVHNTHPPAPLSLLARTSGLSYDVFEALEQQRLAISLPVMRGSVHLMATEDAPWIFAATRENGEKLIKRVTSRVGDRRSFDDYRAKLLPMLSDPVPGANIRESLGIDEEEFLAIRLMTRSGEVLRLSTNPRSDRLQYVATEAWLGKPLPKVDRHTALVRLAAAYFDAFGPARVKDFSWWTGLTQQEVKPAIEQLALLDVGDGLLLPPELKPAFKTVEPLEPTSFALLPKWDSYTMGYAPDGRQRFVDDAHASMAYTNKDTRVGATTGDGLPLILQNGRAIASWSHRFSGKKMSVEIALFPGETVDREDVAERFEEVANLMACDTATLKH
ncbi:winged helix DNA-binding domain-containing protein [soil metagenome]